MKITKVVILIALVAHIQLQGLALAQNTNSNKSYKVPLKTGENPVTRFETLVIEPVNLFVQSKPWNNRSPSIQLEINLTENNKKYTTFLWNYQTNENLQTNYPKAFGNYFFSLETSKADIELVVEKSDFKKAFFIDLNQKAVIGNLTVFFEKCIGEWSQDSDGNRLIAFNTYTISLSDKNEQKTLSFNSLNRNEKDGLLLEWKEYDIRVLYDSEKLLKLMVCKKD